MDDECTRAQECLAQHRVARQLLGRDDNGQARLARLQQQIDELNGVADRRELVEDDQPRSRILDPQPLVRELFQVLDEDATDQRDVFGSRRGGQTEVRDAWLAETRGQIQRVV